MNDRQENKLSMYDAVQLFLDSDTAPYGAVAAFGVAYADFLSVKNNIYAELIEQAKSTKGITQDKRIAKKLLAELTVDVSGPMKAYALSVKNNSLAKKIDFSRSTLFGARDQALIAMATLVYNEANAILVSLSDFGVKGPEMAALQNVLTDYTGLVQEPRVGITKRAAATKNIERLMNEADDILKIMDGIVEGLKDTEITFYNGYFHAREIVDLSGTPEEEEEETP